MRGNSFFDSAMKRRGNVAQKIKETPGDSESRITLNFDEALLQAEVEDADEAGMNIAEEDPNVISGSSSYSSSVGALVSLHNLPVINTDIDMQSISLTTYNRSSSTREKEEFLKNAREFEPQGSVPLNDSVNSLPCWLGGLSAISAETDVSMSQDELDTWVIQQVQQGTVGPTHEVPSDNMSASQTVLFESPSHHKE
jgi:hypothetical protein